MDPDEAERDEAAQQSSPDDLHQTPGLDPADPEPMPEVNAEGHWELCARRVGSERPSLKAYKVTKHRGAPACSSTIGRVAHCGMMDQPNAPIPPEGPRSPMATIPIRPTLQGFIESDHQELHGAIVEELTGWIQEVRWSWKETVVEGIDQAVHAFLGLFTDPNTGKMLVKT